MDVWFTRFNDSLYCVTTKHDEAPQRTPFLLRDGVKNTLRRMQEQGFRIDSVGICPPDMLGLE